jgi:proline dehydrogenase
MEDSPHVDATLRIFRKMCQGDFCDHIGIVIQAYLFRSEEDIRQLAGDRARVRLCKGAYKEPATIAFPQKSDVDANYDRLTRILVECTHEAGTPTNGRSGKVPPILAVASHDVKRINYAKACAQEAGLSKEQVEFQMLYGIRRDLQEQLVQEGYPVRVYVPYGSEWYPYVMRRLAERPANLWFFVSNFFRR